MPSFIDIFDRLNKAYEYRDAAEADGNCDYYYWDGYIAALDYVTDGFCPSKEEEQD